MSFSLILKSYIEVAVKKQSVQYKGIPVSGYGGPPIVQVDDALFESFLSFMAFGHSASFLRCPAMTLHFGFSSVNQLAVESRDHEPDLIIQTIA